MLWEGPNGVLVDDVMKNGAVTESLTIGYIGSGDHFLA
jgi:hypothetical protein